MIFPLYQLDAFQLPTAKALAVILGLLFGLVLERSGFGRAPVLAAQFYYRDNRVLKVMFTSIVTALVGLSVFRAFGLLDFGAMVVPKTFLWPMLAGGFLLGAGFIMSGYCPGTSIVATASRKLDGLMTFVGVALGSIVFGFAYPWVKGFFLSGDMGVYRLPDLLHVPEPVVVLAVFVMAVGAFVGAEALEKKVAAKEHAPTPMGLRPVRNGVFVTLGVLTLLSFMPPLKPARAAGLEVGTISPWTLARTMVKDRSSIEILCLRREVPKKPIPGAIRPPKGMTLAEFVTEIPVTRTLVVVLEKDRALPQGLSAFQGKIVRLEGGYEKFKKLFMEPPKLEGDMTPAKLRAFEERNAIFRFLTGSKAPSAPRPKRMPRKTRRKLKKDGGCG